MDKSKQKEEFEKAFGRFAEESGIDCNNRNFIFAPELQSLMISLREWLFDNYTFVKKGGKK